MYLELEKRLAERIRGVLKTKYDLTLESIPVEIPPELKFGELATPIALQLARTLRKAPKMIAQEIVAELGALEGFAGFEVAGAGYINARLDRAHAVSGIVRGDGAATDDGRPIQPAALSPVGWESKTSKGENGGAPTHSLVEHTSINPNKAAHIGHLRNAILGDTFVRLLRAAGQKVDVQNYIDNTGVQVADVVVGFLHIEKKSLADVRALIESCAPALYRGGILPENATQADPSTPRAHGTAEDHSTAEHQHEHRAGGAVGVSPALQRGGSQSADEQSPVGTTLNDERASARQSIAPFDYYCWDLYARTSQWYTDGSPAEQESRKRLRYDTLHAIEHGGNETAEIADLISTAVLGRHLETMLRLGIEYDFLPRESEILHLKFWELAFEQLKQKGVLYFETEGKNKGCWVMTRPGSEKEPIQNEDGTKGTDEDAKVIVRSNGTVTYVGKDIAYHLWKFGLLGRDFGYKPFFTYPNHQCWISTEHGDNNHPHFGGAGAIYNVIDSRQSDPQANVIQALRGMGFTEQADHYTHFSYEMVALTPRCAVELGYTVAEEDLARPYIEVSGRKGFGVKADDLIDKLIAATREETDKRQTGRDEAERQKIAEQIAIGALRYFMLKFTRNSVIAFDFKDALSFEGETGPYCQYAVVRIRNIFRKGETTPEAVLTELSKLAPKTVAAFLSGEENEDIWALWLRAGRRTMVLEQCISASEPAYLAKHVFQLAQEFSNFYHHHHILTEEDPARKVFLLATAAVALRELVTCLSWLGIDSPEAM